MIPDFFGVLVQIVAITANKKRVCNVAQARNTDQDCILTFIECLFDGGTSRSLHYAVICGI